MEKFIHNKINQDVIKQKSDDLNKIIYGYLPEVKGYDKTVRDAISYSIRAGGKRLRPMLMSETCKMFGGVKNEVLNPFLTAIEMIHTYSLVHDDLPSMDDDDYRRGLPTTHKKYGEAMGILTGDALLNLSFETALKAYDAVPFICSKSLNDDSINRGEGPEFSEAGLYISLMQRVSFALRILAARSGIDGMVGGQVVDVEKNGCFIDEEMLFYVYEKKTGALLSAAMMVGAVLAGADEEKLSIVERAGVDIGIAFQIRDDILDVIGDEEKIGKPVHSDEENEKSTFVSMNGMESAQNAVRTYTDRAVNGLMELEAVDEEARDFIIGLFEYLVGRDS